MPELHVHTATGIFYTCKEFDNAEEAEAYFQSTKTFHAPPQFSSVWYVRDKKLLMIRAEGIFPPRVVDYQRVEGSCLYDYRFLNTERMS